MGTECYHVLAQLMPSLKEDVEEENKNNNDPVPTTNKKEQEPHDSNGKLMVMPPHLLAIAMACFLSTLSSAQSPTILVLDDLQWADSDSLIILRVLLQYQQIHHLLFLGLYRDDEKEEPSASQGTSQNSYVRFQTWLEETTRNKDPGQPAWPMKVHDMPIGNLSRTETSEWICHMLGLEQDDDNEEKEDTGTIASTTNNKQSNPPDNNNSKHALST